jgi:histone H3/H4
LLTLPLAVARRWYDRPAGRRERVRVPPQLVDYVTELAEGYADRLSVDLCSFAKHARRTIVSTGQISVCCVSDVSTGHFLTHGDIIFRPLQCTQRQQRQQRQHQC